MRTWLFEVGEQAVINLEAMNGLPNLIGSLATVEEQLSHGSYEYIVKIPNSPNARVRECELNKIDKDDTIMKIKVGDSIVRLNGEEAKIVLIDYLHRQVEVEYPDGSMEVVGLDKFIHKEVEQ